MKRLRRHASWETGSAVSERTDEEAPGLGPAGGAEESDIESPIEFSEAEIPEPAEGDDGVDDDLPDLADYSSEDEPPVDPVARLIDYLIMLLMFRKISARDFCTINHWAYLAGIARCKDFKLRPEASSGHFNRKCKKTVGYVPETRFYKFKYPGAKRTRSVPLECHAFVPHELLEHDAKTDAMLDAELEELIENDEMPPCYTQNPVVQAHGHSEHVLPVGVFVDGVPYSHVDGCIGWWIVNLITGARLLFATLRKKKTVPLWMPRVVQFLGHVAFFSLELGGHGYQNISSYET